MTAAADFRIAVRANAIIGESPILLITTEN